MSKLDELGGLKVAHKIFDEDCHLDGPTIEERFGRALIERIEELERELANANARVRNKDVEISGLNYHLDTMKGRVPKRPWRWVKKFQMGGGNHWCLESIPEPDNGVGDGHDRTVGIVLEDYWSHHPTELMLFVQTELNLSAEREAKLQRYRKLAKKVLLEGRGLKDAPSFAEVKAKARELLKADKWEGEE